MVRLGFVNQIILAAPSAIVDAAITDGRVFLAAFATTVIEIVAAILIAWTLGIIVGVVAEARTRWRRRPRRCCRRSSPSR